MTEDSAANNRRPSIATIFNPRRLKGGNPNPQLKPKHLHPRPSVVVTDEDTPTQALTLTNGVGEVADGSEDGLGVNVEEGGVSRAGVGGIGSGGGLGLQGITTRDRSSTVSDRGVGAGVGLGARAIGSRASSGSINVTGNIGRSLNQSQHGSTSLRHARSPSINLASSVPSTDNDPGKRFVFVSLFIYYEVLLSGFTRSQTGVFTRMSSTYVSGNTALVE